ncbi:4-hydroxy-tetrahydrodipicolinate synthase [Alistipes sp. ZOR0009]|jgi:4-hydroxy-tetrahydrodipicolinate synthase|uniref:4-hydroxy-tetrahydrodipicolinate synthase n=1 Tax=Alistipes sp. ZOR0009 TaxID=1339253 RepID=UPI00068E7A1C|nr:4-hydroxy-tetrahydrodipicolinate synthase [Alistipes sp. ZOR0009]
MNLRGVGVALVTPFNEDGSVDFESLTRLVDYVSANDVDYLVVHGTTGETPVLTKEEKRAVVKHVYDNNKAKLPIVVGCGGNCTADVIALLNDEMYKHADAILSVTPYYNKPNQTGLYEHYKAIALASKKPVILYNVPGRTGVNLTAETIIRLANDFENIVAIKEANTDFNQLIKVLKGRPEGFLVLSADDAHVVPQIAVGADGVISVAANSYPKDFCSMVHLALNGKFAEATPIVYKLADAIDLLFAEGNPTGVKAALSKLGICKNVLRLPLVPASDKLYQQTEQFVNSNM